MANIAATLVIIATLYRRSEIGGGTAEGLALAGLNNEPRPINGDWPNKSRSMRYMTNKERKAADGADVKSAVGLP